MAPVFQEAYNLVSKAKFLTFKSPIMERKMIAKGKRMDFLLRTMGSREIYLEDHVR